MLVVLCEHLLYLPNKGIAIGWFLTHVYWSTEKVKFLTVWNEYAIMEHQDRALNLIEFHAHKFISSFRINCAIFVNFTEESWSYWSDFRIYSLEWNSQNYRLCRRSRKYLMSISRSISSGTFWHCRQCVCVNLATDRWGLIHLGIVLLTYLRRLLLLRI